MTAIKIQGRNGRRINNRVIAQFPVELRFKTLNGNFESVKGTTTSLQEGGISCSVDRPIPFNTHYAYLAVYTNHHACEVSGQVIWVNKSGRECGVKVEKSDEEWKRVILDILNDCAVRFSPERRRVKRRQYKSQIDTDKRKSDRRFLNLLSSSSSEEAQNIKIKKFFRNKATTYTSEMMKARREWIADLTKVNLKHIAYFSENPVDFRGKIESPIGVAHVPVGIMGPLKINGEHARGIYFVPMATTEGALITSYAFGSNIITRSGGANVRILKDELKSDPTFVFKSSSEAMLFLNWLEGNFMRIKEITEGTSEHLQLIKITPLINGRRVILNFHFNTGDAMGMNMAYKATDVACKMIRESVYPEEFWLHSNINSVKKTTANNFLTGYGKSVMADVTIPRKVLEILDTRPEEMERYYFRTMLASAQGILFGTSAHVANAMTAISIACGQDAALVGNTHLAILACEVNKEGDLYFSIYLPSVFAATVGGGTAFGTGKECLEILGCYGTGKSKKLAEIMVATAMAGEISLMTSVVNGTYIYAHETFGRNKLVID